MQQCLEPFILIKWYGFSSHNCVAKKVNKQAEGKIKNFKLDEGLKNKKAGKQGNNYKAVKQGRSPIFANILVDN